MSKKFFSMICIVIILIGLTVTAVYAVNNKNTTKTNTTGNVSAINAVDENEVTASSTQIENTTTNETKNETTTQKQADNNKGFGLIAVALSTGLACVGAGIAVATVGSSAVGAISENPKLLGKTIIFVGLAEGIAIYGLIISIMILNQIQQECVKI